MEIDAKVHMAGRSSIALVQVFILNFTYRNIYYVFLNIFFHFT